MSEIFKVTRDRGNVPEEIKWPRAIRVWWVLMYMGMHPSMKQREVMCVKDRRSTLPKYSDQIVGNRHRQFLGLLCWSRPAHVS